MYVNFILHLYCSVVFFQGNYAFFHHLFCHCSHLFPDSAHLIYLCYHKTIRSALLGEIQYGDFIISLAS